MRERPQRDEVYAGASDFPQALERDAAAGFKLRAPAGARDGLAQLGVAHVVQQDPGCAGRQRLFDLLERAAFDLDRQFRGMRSCAAHRRTDAPGQRRMVFLDQDRVDTVRRGDWSAARRDGRLLQRTQSRGRLARVENPVPVPSIAATQRAVSVATPDSRCRKLSAVRSAVRIAAAEP